jgi:hypothetical protein
MLAVTVIKQPPGDSSCVLATEPGLKDAEDIIVPVSS